MSDDLNGLSDADQLRLLKAELSRRFGKFTRWKALCVEHGAGTDDEKIRLAEEVLEAPSTGTVTEWLTYRLRIQGGKSFDVDEMLAGAEPAPGKDGL